MKTRHYTFTKALIFIFISTSIYLTSGSGADNSAVAVITKTINDVKKKSATTDFAPASKGAILYSGDQVTTEKKSFALIKFQDDGSLIRLREFSVLTINSEIDNGSTIKSSQITKGGLGFAVQKQKNTQFRLTSPTSVASIRGTKGKWCGGEGHDTLVVTEGLVNLYNKISKKDQDVSAGYIGFSNEDGSLSSRKATDEELADANNATLGSNTNELKLELKDSKGNKKELKLRYKQ